MALNCPNCSHSLTSMEQQDGWCEQCGKRLPGYVTGKQSEPAGRNTPLGPSVYRAVSGHVLGWGTVRAGLALVVVGLILLLVGLLFLTIAAMMSSLSTSSSGSGEAILAMLAIRPLVIGAVLLLAGQCMTWAAPAESGARGWAVSIVVVLILQFSLQLLTALPLDRSASRSLALIIFNSSLVLAMLQMTFFLLFLSKVARVYGNRGASINAQIYLVVALAMCLTAFVFYLLALDGSLSIPHRRERPILFTLASVGFTMGIWGAALVGSVRGTITRGLSEGR